MSTKPFVHLHLHSYYSLLDGLQPPEAYVKKAAEQGAPAIALTDHGVMHGAIDFYKACKEYGIKPIIGVEAYIAFNGLHDKRPQVDNKRTHVILLAETQEGYENLLKMTTVAHLEGYYYKPRIDWELMKKHSKGIIALSGCLNGDMAEAILNNDDTRIKELIEKFQSTFGKENYFLELQDHPTIPQQKIVNDKLLEISKQYAVPLVATGDVHYVNSEDNVPQDIMLCIQTGKNRDDTGRMTMMDADYSMQDPEQIYETFKHVPEAIENTLKIAERCNVSFEFGQYRIPTYPVPGGQDANGYLRDLCYGGLITKYKLAEHGLKTPEQVKVSEDPFAKQLVERLEYELGVIEKMGFTHYFLIVWDFVKWAKDHEIVVGPGRGSAAGAIVAYALDITEIDPLRYDLLFERFLNPARISMPDIDLDFADHRRDEVLEYVTKKYGRDRVAQICTFGTMAARAAVKDVGRVLGVPFVEMNEFVKLIPERPGTKLAEAFEQSADLREVIEANETLKQVWDNATKLEGAVRHVSVHACAVVIADDPLTKYTALQAAPKDEKTIITQYSAKPIEALGLLKMDFLGLKNLTILETALKIIERTKNTKVNLKEILVDDAKTYALLSRGETTGVFQLESAGMKRYLKELRPTEFEDIIAMVSLYRPGPMEWIPEYIAGKHGRKQVSYLHPSLEPILKTTYGIAIYQEQILKIAQVFGGFSLGGADLLRRAIGKKIIEELMAQREKFVKGAEQNGYKTSLAELIFDKVIEPFAGYGFNKSHAACYARIAYETAYLKAHYPTEFMTALMSADYGNTDKIVLEIGECEQMGIQVLPPDINESLSNFTVVEDGKIRFGLSAIKGLGEGSVYDIIAARGNEPFASIEDFARRSPAKTVNKKTIEALAFSGAMDSFGERNQIGLHHELISQFSKTAESSHQVGQAGLFDNLSEEAGAPVHRLSLPAVTPAPPSQRLKWEKEFLGLYVSSHPLGGLVPYFRKKTIAFDDLYGKTVGKPIKVGGILNDVRKITTKNGGMMAILFLEDTSGKGEAVVFPKTYAKVFDQLVPDTVLFINGTLEKRMGDMQVVVSDIESCTLDDLQEKAKKEKLWDPNERITRRTRFEEELEDVENAEEILGVPPVAVTQLNGLFRQSAGGAYQLVMNRPADKEFLMRLKDIIVAHPGSESLELVIGESVLPIPTPVTISSEFQATIDELLRN